MKLKTITSLTVVTVSLSLVSCNTMAGLGQDFQKLGGGMQKTAQGGLWKAPAQQVPAYQQAPAYTPIR